MPSHSHPFTKQDLSQINAALVSLREVEALIAKAQAAGIDVGQYDSDCQTCKGTLEGIKREFFGVKPSVNQ